VAAPRAPDDRRVVDPTVRVLLFRVPSVLAELLRPVASERGMVLLNADPTGGDLVDAAREAGADVVITEVEGDWPLDWRRAVDSPARFAILAVDRATGRTQRVEGLGGVSPAQLLNAAAASALRTIV
jgi:voltage-gated potassium channel Kch